jgi:hypothetical protein
MIWADHPDLHGQYFSWQQTCGWIDNKITWEMTRGTDAAIIIELLRVQAGFIDSYLIATCQAKENAEIRAQQTETSLESAWERSQKTAKAAAELEKQVTDLKRQLEFTQIELDKSKKQLEDYYKGEGDAIAEPSGTLNTPNTASLEL